MCIRDRLMLSQPRMWRYNLVWRKDRVTGHLNANRMPLRQHEDIIVFYDRQPVYHPQMMPCPPERKNHGRRKTDGFTNRCYGEMKLAPVRVAEDKYPTSVISIPKEHKLSLIHILSVFLSSSLPNCGARSLIVAR